MQVTVCLKELACNQFKLRLKSDFLMQTVVLLGRLHLKWIHLDSSKVERLSRRVGNFTWKKNAIICYIFILSSTEEDFHIFTALICNQDVFSLWKQWFSFPPRMYSSGVVFGMIIRH